MKRLVLAATIALNIAACGSSSDDDKGGASSAISSSSIPSSSSSLSSSAQSSSSSEVSGQALFNDQCADCHQLDSPSLVLGWSSEAELAASIAADMPLIRPADCDLDCGEKIAAYIAANNSNFGQSQSSSSAPGGGLEAEPAQGSIDPAPVTVRRLNRAEYNNTVQALLGTSLSPADEFPEDDFGYGFNNIAKVLTVSLTHLEKYMAAAQTLAAEAVANATPQSAQRVEAEDLEGDYALASAGTMILQRGDSTVFFNYNSPLDARYALRIRAGQHAGGPDDARMVLLVNGVEAYATDVAAPSDAMEDFDTLIDLPAGNNVLTLAFTNDYWIEDEADRNLVLDWLEIDGPLDNNASAGSLAVKCDYRLGASCASDTITQLVPRAWRRPLAAGEADELLAVYNAALSATDSNAKAMETLIQAILMSPNFMFRSEFDADIGSHTAVALDAYELATRLSYFLWSSMPDETLFTLAANGSLLNDEVLSTQVARMLDDPRSSALIDNFAVQWLSFDKVAEVTPNADLFPGFDTQLVEALRTETRLFLQNLMASNAPVAELFSADYSYINADLAQHYGVSFSGTGFEKYNWGDQPRRGILGQASVLTATSHPTSTSPVKRGVWVLEKLLCRKPPPPPPGVENLAEDVSLEGLSTRERFELHSDTSSVCYSCHSLMDPIGFGLENYNPIGQWREFDDDVQVNSAGTLPNGTNFNGPVELADVLASGSDLPLCTIQHLMTYALGRGVEALDANIQEELPDYPAVYDVYSKTFDSGNRMRDIVKEIVLSPAFRMRRGADSE